MTQGNYREALQHRRAVKYTNDLNRTLHFRSLHTVSTALFAKLWWNLRVSTSSLWASFMWIKYCKKSHTTLANHKGASHVWRKMVEVREQIEHEIWWQAKNGEANFWLDNWTKQGALYFIERTGNENLELEVRHFVNEDGWNREALEDLLTAETCQMIYETVKPPNGEYSTDKAWWMPNTHGKFTVASAYDLLRKRKTVRDWNKEIWSAGVPFKVNFCLWRGWNGRIATDDNLKFLRLHIVSRCYCCDTTYHQETMNHLFLTSHVAEKLWEYFANGAGIHIRSRQLRQFIMEWWTQPMNYRVKAIIRAAPAFILWELWRRRNSRRHGKDVSITTMIKQVQNKFFWLAKTLYPKLKMGMNWKEILTRVNSYRPNLQAWKVIWDKPQERWIKCNTDGASRGNLGEAAYGFSLRDHNGDFLYAESGELGIKTNMEG